MKKCKNCNKKLKNNQKNFCSHYCVGKFYGKEKGLKSAEVNRKNKTNAFFSLNYEQRVKNSMKAVEKNRKNRTGAFFDSKIKSETTKKTHKKYPNMIQKIAETNRRNKTSAYHNKELQRINGRKGGLRVKELYPNHFSKIGKISGLRTIKLIRANKPYRFMGVNFDSKAEKEIAMIFHKKINLLLVEGKNCHVRVGFKEYDFFINGIFIEFHPFDMNRLTDKEYYLGRRKNLDKNGFKNYPLIVIKNKNELKQENNLIKSELCKQNNKYSWCGGVDL